MSYIRIYRGEKKVRVSCYSGNLHAGDRQLQYVEVHIVRHTRTSDEVLNQTSSG